MDVSAIKVDPTVLKFISHPAASEIWPCRYTRRVTNSSSPWPIPRTFVFSINCGLDSAWTFRRSSVSATRSPRDRGPPMASLRKRLRWPPPQSSQRTASQVELVGDPPTPACRALTGTGSSNNHVRRRLRVRFEMSKTGAFRSLAATPPRKLSWPRHNQNTPAVRIFSSIVSRAFRERPATSTLTRKSMAASSACAWTVCCAT